MTRFNLQEACLLDASGELGPAARQALGAYLRGNPEARRDYHEIRKQYEGLRGLPSQLTARQREEIPAQLKAALQAAFARQTRTQQAARRRKLIVSALAGVASAAAMVAVVAILGTGDQGARTWQARDREQVARIDAALARFAPGKDTSSYEQAVTDMEASIRQLQTDSPTLAQLHDRNMGNLLDALAGVSQDWDDFALSEPPAPAVVPASFEMRPPQR